MSWRSFIIAIACLAMAFALFWAHKDGGSLFLTLLGGSPLAAEGINKTKEALRAAIGGDQSSGNPPANG